MGHFFLNGLQGHFHAHLRNLLRLRLNLYLLIFQAFELGLFLAVLMIISRLFEGSDDLLRQVTFLLVYSLLFGVLHAQLAIPLRLTRFKCLRLHLIIINVHILPIRQVI